MFNVHVQFKEHHKRYVLNESPQKLVNFNSIQLFSSFSAENNNLTLVKNLAFLEKLPIMSTTSLLSFYISYGMCSEYCLKYEYASCFFPRPKRVGSLLPYEIRHVFNLYANSEFQNHKVRHQGYFLDVVAISPIQSI